MGRVDPDSGLVHQAQDMLHAADVAAAVLFAVTRPPRVEVTELRLMPTLTKCGMRNRDADLRAGSLNERTLIATPHFALRIPHSSPMVFRPDAH